ncbi:MAG: hypothetical protein IJ736_05115 [Firmicutes bacterium]|nr:hypothetical protein [Bacillota bacterium]
MKFKRIASVTMTGALLGAICTGAFAEDNAESTQHKLMVAEPDTSYVLTIPANMNNVQSGWNDLEGGINVKNENKTFSDKNKVKVTASSENEWNLKLDDTNKISYELKSSEEAAETVNEWEFSAADLNKDGGETKNIGIEVAGYDDNVAAGDYTDTITFTAEVKTTATAKTPANTPNITQADCTFAPSNGKSTLSNSNITALMEYSTDNGTTWNDVATNSTISSLSAGTVQIRVKETDENLASESVSITVPEVLKTNELVGPYSGDKLTVEFYDGETWNDMSNRYSLIKIYSGRAAFGSDGFIYLPSGSATLATDKVSTSITYEVQ